MNDVIRPRLSSVDLLRGIVMVIMALDHTRDYFSNVQFGPLDLSQTFPALFLTRFITHFCAPVFVFLAGTGAFLSTTRGKTKKELSLFLATRGAWLVVAELTIVRFGWFFNFDYSLVIGQVIWAIGCSMIVLSVLVFFSTRAITIFGIVMIVVHNAFDNVHASQLGIFGWPWQILHDGGVIVYSPGHAFLAFYPLVPWIGVMAAGFGFGTLLLRSEEVRRKILFRLGASLILAFIIIRATNLYGDPNPWSVQKDFLFTIFSFINCQKYPPSLLYLLMTLGPAIMLLPLLERLHGKVARFFTVFGRVPMFYYILHIPLIHLAVVIVGNTLGYDTGFLFSNNFWSAPRDWGFGLPIVYAVWLCVIIILYPLCRWFAGVKERRKDAWLSYL